MMSIRDKPRIKNIEFYFNHGRIYSLEGKRLENPDGVVKVDDLEEFKRDSEKVHNPREVVKYLVYKIGLELGLGFLN